MALCRNSKGEGGQIGFLAQVAARGLCGPRPEAFRSGFISARYGRRSSCIAVFAWEVFENEHLHKMGWGGTSAIVETQG
jgi:hypothetical protein